MAITDFLSGGLLDTAGQLGTAKYAYDLPQDAIDTLNRSSGQFASQAGQLGAQAAERTAFQPFAVRTGTGQTNVGAQGGLDVSVGAPQQGIATNLLGQAGALSQQAPVTAESLFQQLTNMQRPEQERQRLALENRLQAQGRGGVSTAAYGGTPEQLAMQKAIQEQQSANAFNATNQAGVLQGQQTQNILGLLGGSYLPQQQELAALQAASPFAQLSQAGRQGEAEALYKSGIAGLEAQAGGQLGVANLEAARAQAFGNALQGLFANTNAEGDRITSTASSALDALSGLFGGGTSAAAKKGLAIAQADQNNPAYFGD